MNTCAVWCRRYGLAVVLIVAIRARYLFSPMTSDEGGYLAIARAWARGATLYKDVWVDRPQGLLATFAILDRVGLGNTFGVRLFAMAVCVVAAVACGHIAATLAGERARWVTAVMVGVLTSVPQAEGFIANAELLSCTAGAVSLALILSSAWKTESEHRARLFAAGVAGGVALSLKQSGFDALLVGVVVLVMTAGTTQRGSRVIRRLSVVGAGALVPVLVMAVHGALTGWHRWWYAVVGYRIEQRSGLTNTRWAKFGASFDVVMPVISVIIVVCVVLVIVRLRNGQMKREMSVLGTWLFFAVLAFLVGGNFFRHYWVIVMFPLGTLIGVLISHVRGRNMFITCFAVALAMPLGLTAKVLTTPRDRIGPEIHANTRLIRDEKVARWFNENSRHDDSVYALCASAGLYGQIDAAPPFPYLWFDDIRQTSGAVDRLVTLLSSDIAPRFVAVYQRPRLCDPTGSLTTALQSKYSLLLRIDGVPIFEHQSRFVSS